MIYVVSATVVTDDKPIADIASQLLTDTANLLAQKGITSTFSFNVDEGEDEDGQLGET